MGSWSLVGGWLPWTVTVAGLGSGVAMLVTRRRTFWTRTAPIVVGTVVVLVAVLDIVVDDVWRPFPDHLPVSNLVWGGVGLLGVGIAAGRFAGLRWRYRMLAVAAAVTLLATSAVQINVFWAMFPTVHSVHAAMHPAPTKPLGPAPTGPTVTAPPGQTLRDVWRPPAGLPAAGSVAQAHIPGTASRFPARPGFVYLPPAYQASPRPLLPVLVLLAGQPGSPSDWLSFFNLTQTADAYARTHQGLGPVIVMPDDLGAPLANPLCVDSPLGNAETYLSVDVPAWIQEHLQVDQDREGWFIGGYSHGGTCALQLAVRAPQRYGGFIDMSGQREPTLGSRASTVKRAFGGSATAFARVNPLDILTHTRYPQTAGYLVAGTGDQTYLPQQRDVRDACRTAGMDITWAELPGGHNAVVWREGLVRALPWLGVRARLAPSDP